MVVLLEYQLRVHFCFEALDTLNHISGVFCANLKFLSLQECST